VISGCHQPHSRKCEMAGSDSIHPPSQVRLPSYHLAAEAFSCDTHATMTTAFPNASSLKPDLIQRIESMTEEELRLVHEVLLHAEKDRLWREISAEAEAERESGRWDKLPKIISEVRSQLRQA
jgi:hypothetical protein